MGGSGEKPSGKDGGTRDRAGVRGWHAADVSRDGQCALQVFGVEL